MHVPLPLSRPAPTRFWERCLPAGQGYSPERFAARLLHTRVDRLHIALRSLDAVEYPAVAARLASEWADDQLLGGGHVDSLGIANWGTLDLHDGTAPRRIPDRVTGLVRHDATDLVVCITSSKHHAPAWLRVYARAEDRDAAKACLRDLVRSGPRSQGIFFGRFLRTSFSNGLALTPLPPPEVKRGDVHLPPGMWAHLDHQIIRTLARAKTLQGTPLSGPRGVLLHGPPGTGKSSICKVLAAELMGQATVIEVAHASSPDDLRNLYEVLPSLSPAVVILEDVDTWASRRYGSASRGLSEFLNALDGVGTGNAAVVTLMTTNDLNVLDDAAKRAGRIDVTIEVPRPGRQARTGILQGLLDHTDHKVDLPTVVDLADGLTAADLREVVRDAALTVTGPITSADLIERVQQRTDMRSAGVYL